MNKQKCQQCKYSMSMGGGNDYDRDKKSGMSLRSIICGYALIAHNTCLKQIDGEVVDMRGDDPDCCGLYSPKEKARNGRLY